MSVPEWPPSRLEKAFAGLFSFIPWLTLCIPWFCR